METKHKIANNSQLEQATRNKVWQANMGRKQTMLHLPCKIITSPKLKQIKYILLGSMI